LPREANISQLLKRYQALSETRWLFTVLTCQTPAPILSQMSAVHTISSCYFRNRSNIITPPKPRIPKSSAVYKVPYQNFVWTHPGLFWKRKCGLPKTGGHRAWTL